MTKQESARATLRADEERYLSYRSLAERWETSRDTIDRICATGVLTKVYIGKRNVRFALSEVVRLEQDGTV